MKKIIIIILLVSFILGFAQNKPKNVGIYILNPSGQKPVDANLIFEAYITSRPGEVLTQSSTGCGYEELSTLGLCYINLASFTTAWSQGDVIRWEVTESSVLLGEVNQSIGSADGASQFDTDYWGHAFLPVTLSSFTAVYQNGSPVLQWITQSEINNSGWNIYRSQTEEMDTSLQINPGLIPGGGTTTEPQAYAFTDEADVQAETTYYYMLESVDYSGSTEQYGPISIIIPAVGENDSPEIPIVYGLHPNYPNPFNPDTKISFIPEQEGKVTINILNIKGQRIKTLCNENIATDQIGVLQSHIWDGTNDQGRYVSSGIYFYKYESPLKTQTKKMLLIK